MEESGWKRWPPRLADQPIFYPILNFGYAEKIARDWNSWDAGHDYLGIVTEFEVDAEFASKYPNQLAGSRECEELWVPAEELEDFNDHIIWKIRLVATYKNKERIS